jgi:hypothetical protein
LSPSCTRSGCQLRRCVPRSDNIRGARPTALAGGGSGGAPTEPTACAAMNVRVLSARQRLARSLRLHGSGPTRSAGLLVRTRGGRGRSLERRPRASGERASACTSVAARRDAREVREHGGLQYTPRPGPGRPWRRARGRRDRLGSGHAYPRGTRARGPTGPRKSLCAGLGGGGGCRVHSSAWQASGVARRMRRVMRRNATADGSVAARVSAWCKREPRMGKARLGGLNTGRVGDG